MPIPKIPGWNFHAPTSKSVKIPEVKPAQAPELSDENDKSQLPPLPKTKTFAPPLPPQQKPAKAIPAHQVGPDGKIVDDIDAKSTEAEQEAEETTLRDDLLEKQKKARQEKARFEDIMEKLLEAQAAMTSIGDVFGGNDI